MICPKCGNKVSQEVNKCHNCQFNLNYAFNEFYKREKKIHNEIHQMRINEDKLIYDNRIELTNYLFIITDTNSFHDNLDELGISNEEWNCLQFKLISEIYLSNISKKPQVRNDLSDLIQSYDGEYKFKIDVLSKNLTNLIQLRG